jgi:hypothetical protein
MVAYNTFLAFYLDSAGHTISTNANKQHSLDPSSYTHLLTPEPPPTQFLVSNSTRSKPYIHTLAKEQAAIGNALHSCSPPHRYPARKIWGPSKKQFMPTIRPPAKSDHQVHDFPPFLCTEGRPEELDTGNIVVRQQLMAITNPAQLTSYLLKIPPKGISCHRPQKCWCRSSQLQPTPPRC